MASLWADENVPYSLVEALRALGHDVLTAFEDGRTNQRIPDSEVLRHARELGRAVLTNNRRDFHTLHRNFGSHTGIITFTDDRDSSALASRIHAGIGIDAVLTDRLIKVVRPNPS